MEWLLVKDEGARFAMLASGQVDMAIGVPFSIAGRLPRAPLPKQDINPDKGPIWIQVLNSAGKMNIGFDAISVVQEKLHGWEEWADDPVNDVRVREALELAIDKRAIVDDFHFGFTVNNQSIWHKGVFGWRSEVGENISPFDPVKAKTLLADAGYAAGFDTQIHFGVFTGRPGQPEALDAIASYWKDVGVNVTVVEQDPREMYSKINSPVRAWRPMSLNTWGRQEDPILIAHWGYSGPETGSGRAGLLQRENDRLGPANHEHHRQGRARAIVGPDRRRGTRQPLGNPGLRAGDHLCILRSRRIAPPLGVRGALHRPSEDNPQGLMSALPGAEPRAIVVCLGMAP